MSAGSAGRAYRVGGWDLTLSPDAESASRRCTVLVETPSRRTRVTARAVGDAESRPPDCRLPRAGRQERRKRDPGSASPSRPAARCASRPGPTPCTCPLARGPDEPADGRRRCCRASHTTARSAAAPVRPPGGRRVGVGNLGMLAQAVRMGATVESHWSLNVVNPLRSAQLATNWAAFVWLSPELSGRQIGEVAHRRQLPVGPRCSVDKKSWSPSTAS